MELFDLTTVFIVAFLASVGHCIGMCGGFILAYSTAKIGEDWTKSHQGVAHFLYNFGRVTSYVILGALFGLVGSAFVITLTVWGSVLIVVGVLMVLMGLSLMGKLSFLTKIEATISKNGLYGKAYKALVTSKTLPSFYGLGMLNGFIPCGLVYIFGVFAIASGSVATGMLIMGVFGVATMPILLSFGFFATLLQKSRFRKIALTIAALLVIGYGLFTLLKGTMMIVKPEMIEKKIEVMKTKELELLNKK